jgi:hypothetical protein
MDADKLPFRSQAAEMRTGVRPVGELEPFRERGQTAPGGASMADAIGAPDATEGQSGSPFKNLKG